MKAELTPAGFRILILLAAAILITFGITQMCGCRTYAPQGDLIITKNYGANGNTIPISFIEPEEVQSDMQPQLKLFNPAKKPAENLQKFYQHLTEFRRGFSKFADSVKNVDFSGVSKMYYQKIIKLLSYLEGKYKEKI